MESRSSDCDGTEASPTAPTLSAPVEDEDNDDEVMIVFDNFDTSFESQSNHIIPTPTTPVKPKSIEKPSSVTSVRARGDLQTIDKAIPGCSKNLMNNTLEVKTAVGTRTVNKETDRRSHELKWHEQYDKTIMPPEKPFIEPITVDNDNREEDQDAPQLTESTSQISSNLAIISGVGNAVLPTSCVVEDNIAKDSAESIVDLEVETQKRMDLENAKLLEDEQNISEGKSDPKSSDLNKVVTADQLSLSVEDNYSALSVGENFKDQDVNSKLPETSANSVEEIEKAISKGSTSSKEIEVILPLPVTLTGASSKENSVVKLLLEQELEELFPGGENTEEILKSSQTPVVIEVMDVEDFSKKRKCSNDEVEQQEVNPKANKRTKPDEDDLNGIKEEAEDDNGEIDLHTNCRREQQSLLREMELLRGKVDRLTYRQMLIEDFALVEFGSKFRTFFHARTELLEMGKQRVVSNPAHVLAPGSSYLIGILKMINQKATRNEKDTGEPLVFSDVEIKKIEKDFRDSETFNTSGESLSKFCSNQKSSSSSLVSFNGTKSVSQNSVDSSSSKPSDRCMIANPLFKRPKPSLNNSQTKTGHQQSPMGCNIPKSTQKSSAPSTSGNQVQPSKTTTAAQSKQPKATSQSNIPKALRIKNCAICGDEYVAKLLKVHANLHAGIVFQCHECKVLHTDYQKAQDCIKAHGFGKPGSIRAYVKNDDGKLTAIGEEDISRLQDQTINKMHIGINKNLSRPQPNQDQRMMQQQSLQRKEMIQQQSIQRKQRAVQSQSQSLQQMSRVSKNPNFQEMIPRNLIDQQMTQQQNIQRQQSAQEQNIQRQQQMIQEEILRRQILNQQGGVLLIQQQQIIQPSHSLFASSVSGGESSAAYNGNKIVTNNPISARPGYFTTSYVPSPGPNIPQPTAVPASLDGSTDLARRIALRAKKNKKRQKQREHTRNNQLHQGHEGRHILGVPGRQGSYAFNPQHYNTYSEYAKHYLQSKHCGRDGRRDDSHGLI